MTKTSEPPQSNSPASYSGRRVTQVVILLMVALGGTLAYALWSYAQLENIRKDQRAAWATMREPLVGRYREIEKSVAVGVDSGSIPIIWAEKFRLAVDAFRTTAQAPDQYAAAEAVENLLIESGRWKPPALEVPKPSEEVSNSLAAFNSQLVRESQQLQSPGCQLLDIFLEFRQPGKFDLAPQLVQ